MKRHTIAVALALPLLSLFAASPAASQVSMEIGVRFGPPPPRYEVMFDAPFQHAVWIKGHWGWNGYAGRYAWVPGRWVARRPAYTWVDGGWHRGPRGWSWTEGGWRHNGNGQWSREFDRERKDGDHPGQGWGNDNRPGNGRGNGRGNGHGRG